MNKFTNPATGQTYTIAEREVNGILYLVHGLTEGTLRWDPHLFAEDRNEARAEKKAELLACGWVSA